MPNNAADVLRLLKTAFSNELFVFEKSYIFFVFLQKLLQKYSLSIFITAINSDIILQECRITFYFNVFEKNCPEESF